MYTRVFLLLYLAIVINTNKGAISKRVGEQMQINGALNRRGGGYIYIYMQVQGGADLLFLLRRRGGRGLGRRPVVLLPVPLGAAPPPYITTYVEEYV